MKIIYEMWRYTCSGCGRFAWEARIPTGHDPKAARPVECGACQSRRFTWEKAA